MAIHDRKDPSVDHRIEFRGHLNLSPSAFATEILGDCGPADAEPFCYLALADPLHIHAPVNHFSAHTGK
jgi:hypothetical protein